MTAASVSEHVDTHVSAATSDDLPPAVRVELAHRAAQLRAADAVFASWAAGYGLIQHDVLTQVRVYSMVRRLVTDNQVVDAATAYARLSAADRVASAGMWLVAHMSYAQRVRLDGGPLVAGDFKANPEGHTGGALNMVPAYVAYLAMNALDGRTRSWMMGQGHCVAAIDALNVLVGNLHPEQAARYPMDDAGLSQLASDFYGYAIGADGMPSAPLGSHVNAHTAGGTQEGGYLGFTELHYVHAPLPGERLVAFLSDGAFEEQRGSDWAPRWWRPEDSGMVAPIMILNGRRIEQRTLIEQQGGESWLHRHLELNGFEVFGLDGRDPASMAWGIHAMEARLGERIAAVLAGRPDPTRRLGYGIAETIKGFGLPGAGGNRAHNLPLGGNPSKDVAALEEFNGAVARLHVPAVELRAAIVDLATHAEQARSLERDHALGRRDVASPHLPALEDASSASDGSPMAALDVRFSAILAANRHLRARIGNPDELRSNRLDHTLDLLKHRVFEPEAGVAEARGGGVITALNEEAVACAALGNKGGINLVVTYEAFAPKMLGALRQEITFARQQRQVGRAPGWLSVPVVLTSHTWENSKNEVSHQDPTLAEALLGEMADSVSVVFPPDANATVAALDHAYSSHGRIVAMVVPKRAVAHRLTVAQAQALASQGALTLIPATAAEQAPRHHGAGISAPQLLLAASGAYQLAAAVRAHARLSERGIRCALIVIGEPGRLRTPRDALEARHVLDDAALEEIFPTGVPRVFITHTRPEPYLGALRRIDSGPQTTRALGYINRGGTLTVDGLLFANRCSWGHVVEAAGAVLGLSSSSLLRPDELAAVRGEGDPTVLWRS